MKDQGIRATIIPLHEAKGSEADLPNTKPPIERFDPIEGISQEEGEAFIELIRKMRRSGLREPRRG
jgi:hypothetical protein